MMLFKLSFKNIRKSIKDYAIYFLTLVLGVAIFYVFNAMDSQEAMFELNSTQKDIIELMNEFLGGVSFFVAIVLGFLIIYASSFLIKRRKKEFGIYLTLGMGKRQVSKILLLETLIIGIFSLFVGLLLGIVASQFMSVIVAKLFEVDMSHYEFTFSQGAMIKTIIYYIIIYIVVMIFNVFAVTKYKLIDLLNASKKGEKVKVRNLTLSVIIFILAVCILGYAYYLATQRLDSLQLFGVSILLGIIGTFLLFFSMSGFILRLVQANKNLYFKNLNAFTLRQFDSKVNTTVFSMSIICILLFLTVTIFSSAMSVNISLKKDLTRLTPVDTVIANYDDDDKVSVELVNNGFALSNFSDYAEGAMYYVDTITVGSSLGTILDEVLKSYPYLSVDGLMPVMKVSEYNRFATLYGLKTYEVKGDEYIIVANYDQTVEMLNKSLSLGTTLEVNDKVLVPRYNECKDGFIMISSNPSNTGIVLVSDNIDLSGSELITYLAGNYNGDKETVENELIKELPDYLSASTKISIYEASVGLGAIMVFIGLYLGIIFLISSAAILALKELSESTDNKEKYQMLKRIGADSKQINRALFMQIGIFFLFPLVIAIIHSVFGIISANKILSSLGQSGILGSIIVTAIFVFLIYGAYFLITYFTSKRIINEK